MVKYTKTINGKKVVKPSNEIIIKTRTEVDGKTVSRMRTNPTEEMLLADGWEIYIQPEPTEEELLQRAKLRKKNEIKAYDKSKNIEEFYISGIPLWLSKADRNGLELRFKAEMSKGLTTTTLWGNGIQFPIPLIDTYGNPGLAFEMLYTLEIYASECYDNTQYHLVEVDKLETIEEIEQYDFKVGYPEKLNF